jgi:hypothetical protein
MKLNHSKRLSEVFGMTEDQFDNLMRGAIDAHNKYDGGTFTGRLEHNVAYVRGKVAEFKLDLDENAFAVLVGLVCDELSEMAMKSRIKRLIDKVTPMCQAGIMQPDVLLTAVMMSLADMIGSEGK